MHSCGHNDHIKITEIMQILNFIPSNTTFQLPFYTKPLFFSLILLFGARALPAQADLIKEVEAQFDRAYVSNNLALWENGIRRLESAHQSQGGAELLFALAKAKYGAVNTCFGLEEEEKAEDFLDQAEKHFKKLLDTDYRQAEVHALLSGTYGMKIALSPISGMFLGSKSNRHLDKALELDPDAPMVRHQKGASLINTPSMFGGDAEAGILELEKAAQLYEQQNEAEGWEYLGTLAMLGKARHSQKQYAQARTAYDKALRVAPDFGWVKYALLPALEEDM